MEHRSGHDGTKTVIDPDAVKKQMSGRHGDVIVRFGPAILFLGLFYYLMNHSGKAEPDISSSRMRIKRASPTQDIPDFSRAFGEYENCKVSWDPPAPKKEWKTKPMWLPSFPGSGSTGPTGKGDILRPLINGVTGLNSGAKFYHASGKNLKRCKGLDETATCSNGHPITAIKPEKQADNFHPSVLMGIRNFRTAFPTYFQDKAIAYHGATGQVDEDDWRQTRDKFYASAFEDWKGLVMTWKEMKEYDIGMYLEYEALMDPGRGPETLIRLAVKLKNAGFNVAPAKDIPCIWFQAVKDEPSRLKEFMKYTPGFTFDQQQFILKELEKFIKEVSDDKDLVAILQEYYTDTRDNTPIDQPSSGAS
jgi:hypothetical protein